MYKQQDSQIYSKKQQNYQQNQHNDKVYFDKRSTKSMSNHYQENCYFDVQSFSQENISPPSPESSSQQGSAEVKYLSYLAQVIDSAPENSDEQQIQQYFHKAQYWHAVYQSAIYVKKDKYRTSIDDNLIMEQLLTYLKPDKIHPQALNMTGQELLSNGYFLTAYAIATGRKRKSCFIFNYLMQYFNNEVTMQLNKEDFDYVFENYVMSNKGQQILNIETHQTPNEHQTNYLNITPGDSQIIRRQHHDFEQNDNSQYSKTIILDEKSEWINEI